MKELQSFHLTLMTVVEVLTDVTEKQWTQIEAEGGAKARVRATSLHLSSTCDATTKIPEVVVFCLKKQIQK